LKEKIIEVRDLNVNRSGTVVIKDANFSVEKGDFIGVVGPNGGGKTTLLLSLLGTIPKASGTIKLFGQNIDSFNEWERVAYVSQNAINFDEHFPMSVRELVALGRANRSNLGRRLNKEDWEAVDESMEFMGLTAIANKRVGNLSGGQKQRVFVAKALVRNPEVIFLDEPTAGVDASTQERFYQKLSDLNARKGTTILIVSHDLAVVFCRMSKVICVSRDVNISSITGEVDPNDILRPAYGEHFHFVFHKHECQGVFDDD